MNRIKFRQIFFSLS